MTKSIIVQVKSFWATFIDIGNFFLVTLVVGTRFYSDGYNIRVVNYDVAVFVRLATSNQSALFNSKIANLLCNSFMISVEVFNI